jgi:hypothetical protein
MHSTQHSVELKVQLGALTGGPLLSGGGYCPALSMSLLGMSILCMCKQLVSLSIAHKHVRAGVCMYFQLLVVHATLATAQYAVQAFYRLATYKQ